MTEENEIENYYPEYNLQEASKLVFSLPNGRPSQILSNLIYYSDSDKSFSKFKDRTERISHSTSVELQPLSKTIKDSEGNEISVNTAYSVTIHNENNDLVFKILNNAKITGFFRDFYIFSMIQFNKQINFNEIDTDSTRNFSISFLLDEAVSYGLSKSPQSLKKQIEKITDYMEYIKVKGTSGTKDNQKSISKDFKSVVLFPSISVKNNVCEVVFFGGINWKAFSSSSFSYLEKCFFHLNQNEKDMLLQIMQLARMRSNQQSLSEEGFFKIAYRVSMKNLKLPDETETNKSKRDIFEKIECDEIINSSCEFVKITSVRSKNQGLNLSQTLNDSYTKVELSGALKEMILKEYEERRRIIDSNMIKKLEVL